MQIARLTGHHARYAPRGAAVVFEEQRLTWAEFDARVNRLAHALLAAGVAKGERVATVLPNCLELLDIYWACARIGAVAVPLSPLLQVPGLRSLLANAMPSVLFACGATVATAAEARDAAASLRLCVSTDVLVDGFLLYGRLVAAQPETDPGVEVFPEDPYNIMYTSGTTGLPKGIVHTQRIRADYGSLFANAWRIGPESVVLHTGAIVFNGAFVTMMPAFTYGATFVLHRQFDPAALIETVARERVTHTMLVPSQIIAILNATDFDPAKLDTLQVLVSLGAPLPVAHKQALEEILPGRFHELYGLTEGFVTILDRRDAVRKRGSVGVPPPFYDMRIVREDGQDAAPGEVGEIVGRGPILMPGYYQRPDLTSDAVRGGWLHTGDLGYTDPDGYLYLVDRKKDMIDSGGVKVYPRDVEEILATHPDVMEAAVFGIPDPKWGETPAAAVTLKTPGALDADSLRTWVNARVAAKFQRVSQVMILESMPRNAAGKVLKRTLREPFWEGRGTRI